MSGQTCTGNGGCGGGTPIAGCTYGDEDAGLSDHEGGTKSDGDAGSPEGSASNGSSGASSGGCSMAAGTTGAGPDSSGLLVLGLVAACRRRRRANL
ncbi:MAG TPA: hypothetical protein VIY73_18785 [Polyangiaceae bacterium]